EDNRRGRHYLGYVPQATGLHLHPRWYTDPLHPLCSSVPSVSPVHRCPHHRLTYSGGPPLPLTSSIRYPCCLAVLANFCTSMSSMDGLRLDQPTTQPDLQ